MLKCVRCPVYVLSCMREQIEGLRGKEALVQVVVKSIARREDKPPETRSDDELRVLLRQKGEATMKVCLPMEGRNNPHPLLSNADYLEREMQPSKCAMNALKYGNAPPPTPWRGGITRVPHSVIGNGNPNQSDRFSIYYAYKITY